MIYGLDYLGGAKYGNLILREHPQGWAAGFFSSTFGDARPVVSKLLETGRCPLVRIHLMWKDDHKFSRKDFPAIIAEAKKWLPLINKYPMLGWQLSPACEHNLGQIEAIEICNQIKALSPAIIPVNTPMTNRGLIGGYTNEFHGGSKAPIGTSFNYSFDSGSAGAEDSDVTTIKQNFALARAFFFWSPRMNGRWETNDTTPRPNRKGWPDSRLIDSLIYLSKDKGQTSLPPKWIWKSHSENKGNGDKRAEKPVLITPVKAKEARLVTSNGQVVASLPYYGTFEGGRHRYYAPDWGYLLAEKAGRIQGSPVCSLVMNGKTYGRVNPAFREGGFR